MSVKDTRTGISRLDEAKEIVDETVSRLKGENASLWAFTAEPTRLSSLDNGLPFCPFEVEANGY